MITVRLWAAQTRQAWGIREDDWGQLPVTERERMIAGHKLPDWLAGLDAHKAEVEAERGR